MPCSVAGQTQPSAALHLSGSAGPPHARNSLPLESNSMTDGAGRQQSPSAPYGRDRKSTRLNSSHVSISYAVFCLKKKNEHYHRAKCLQYGSPLLSPCELCIEPERNRFHFVYKLSSSLHLAIFFHSVDNISSCPA